MSFVKVILSQVHEIILVDCHVSPEQPTQYFMVIKPFMRKNICIGVIVFTDLRIRAIGHHLIPTFCNCSRIHTK